MEQFLVSKEVIESYQVGIDKTLQLYREVYEGKGIPEDCENKFCSISSELGGSIFSILRGIYVPEPTITLSISFQEGGLVKPCEEILSNAFSEILGNNNLGEFIAKTLNSNQKYIDSQKIFKYLPDLNSPEYHIADKLTPEGVINLVFQSSFTGEKFSSCLLVRSVRKEISGTKQFAPTVSLDYTGQTVQFVWKCKYFCNPDLIQNQLSGLKAVAATIRNGEGRLTKVYFKTT